MALTACSIKMAEIFDPVTKFISSSDSKYIQKTNKPHMPHIDTSSKSAVSGAPKVVQSSALSLRKCVCISSHSFSMAVVRVSNRGQKVSVAGIEPAALRKC
jgi:hypothetical protein